MLIAHLPAGYLAAKGAKAAGVSQTVFWGILLGSIVPDFDMLWFHFVDHGNTHHHEYLTHRPLVWAVVLGVGLVFRQLFIVGIGVGAIFHLMLDSIAGKVTWGWPFFDQATTLVVVQPTHDHWVKSFLTHWTFKVEIAVVAFAVFVFIRSIFRRQQSE